MSVVWMDVDAALAELPVNAAPLTDDGDFKTVEESVAYNAAGMELIWHFVTPAGATTATVVTPTTGGGDYDWAHQDGGMYTIKMPATGGASANNDTEGFGYFTGKATGVLPWTSRTYGFRASGLNDKLIESAYNANRGLAGDAVPDAAAGNIAGGGLATAQQVDNVDNFVDTELAALQTDVTTLLSRLGTPSNLGGGATIAQNLADIEAQTDDIGTAGAGLTALPWNSAWDAEVESEANDALIAQNLDHLLKSAVDTDFATTVHLNSVIGHLADNGTSATFDRTTDSLEALQAEHDATQSAVNTVDDLLDTEIAGLTTDLSTVLSRIGTPSNLGGGATLAANLSDIEAQTDDIGTAGAGLTALPWNSSWDAEVQSEVVDGLNTALTESYRGHQATGSVAQMLYELLGHHGASGNVGPTKTIYKLDGITPAKTYTYTLDGGGEPTAIAMAS